MEVPYKDMAVKDNYGQASPEPCLPQDNGGNMKIGRNLRLLAALKRRIRKDGIYPIHSNTPRSTDMHCMRPAIELEKHILNRIYYGRIWRGGI